jgi:hypothetical protein
LTHSAPVLRRGAVSGWNMSKALLIRKKGAFVKNDWKGIDPEMEPEEYRPMKAGATGLEQRGDLRTIGRAAFVSAVLTVGILALYDRFYAQKIVALDVKGYIAEQRDLYLSGKINDAQLKERFDKLEKAKERVPGNRIIILGDVLVRKNVEEIKP